MKKSVFLIVIVLLISVNIFAQDLQFLTHSSKEQIYLDEEGQMRGKQHTGKRAFFVEVVREMMTVMNNSKVIKEVPLKRGLFMVKENANSALFNVTRTDERENQYKWVGPLYKESDYFYEMKNAPTGITSIEDAKKVKSICVLNGSVHESFLKENNFTNFSTNKSYIGCLKMLKMGRVNLTPAANSTISDKAAEAGLTPDQIQQTPVVLFETAGYIAFSRSIPDVTIQKWQIALDQIKKSGKYQQLFDQYFLSGD